MLCHAHNTFDKRILLTQNNPHLKKTQLTLKRLIKDKVVREFYIELAKDYIEKDRLEKERLEKERLEKEQLEKGNEPVQSSEIIQSIQLD